MVTVPSSLRSRDLDRVWDRVRARFEGSDTASLGRLSLPPLSSPAKLALKALVGRSIGKTIDLAALEAGLVRLGVGDDLLSALAALGHGVSAEPARRRAERAERKAAHDEARAIASEWAEPWAREWIDDAIRAGVLRAFDRGQARTLLRQVRDVLDELERDRLRPVSRTDLAARVLGSAHALDVGTRAEAAVARALAFRSGKRSDDDLGPREHRDLWFRAGVHFDLTSAPVLTWGLQLGRSSGLANLTEAARESAIPLHLSRFALEACPAVVPSGTRILVVENPRVVEAAAQKRAEKPVISTNGQPSSTVLLLLTQLLDAGADLHYHGDFDATGLAICERLMNLGLVPWRMSAADYIAALADADAEEAALPIDVGAPGPTPWDPALREAFDRERRIVHTRRGFSGR